MAYYLVKYNQETFGNPDVVRDYLKISDTQLLTLTLVGKIKAEVILGQPFFAVTSEVAADIVKKYHDVTIQNVNVSLKHLEPAVLYRNVINIPKGTSSIPLGGKRFIRFGDIPFANKYNHRSLIPHIKICNNLYAALDCVWDDKQNDSYVLTVEE